MPDQEHKFWAFISYSSKDAAVAKRLHKRLETYRIPRDLRGRPGRDGPVPARLFPVFRDRDELPLSADLGGSIQDALRASAYLIVLCSPNSAKSRWVNEEVRYFKSLGRDDRILAIILDGEPNATEQDNPDAECFPPALRFTVDEAGELTGERAEPIAGDLRKGADGWTACFLKAVAGITGLGYDAFARRQAKRRRRKRAVAAALGLVLLVGGLFAWDYNRLKVDHFANLTTRWGVPEGVGPLDAATRAGREFHYRIESRRYKVRRVVRQNSVGVARNDKDHHHAAIHEVTYREDGSVQQVDLRDHHGRLVLRQEFSELRDTDAGPVHFVEFKQEADDAPLALAADTAAHAVSFRKQAAGRTQITVHRVAYHAHGLPETAHFMDHHRRARANREGAFGQRHQYEDSTLPTKTTTLDQEGEAAPSAAGVAITTFKRDARGDIVETRHFDITRTPTLNARQSAGQDVKRDVFGNPVASVELGPDGRPAPNDKWYSRWSAEYDARGMPLVWRYADATGDPVMTREGYAAVRMAWDDRGRPTAESLFDTHDRPVTLAENYHRVTIQRDDAGHWSGIAYWASDGAPAVHPDGYHQLALSHDEDGRVTDQMYLGVDGRPTAAAFGVPHVTASYDAKGRRSSVATFDAAGNPATSTLGFHQSQVHYDVHGNPSAIAFFDTDGQPGIGPEGYHRVETGYDERGQPDSLAVFGPDGEPTHTPEGYHREQRAFNEAGHIVEQAFFDGKGNSVVQAGGYHALRTTRDDRGNALEYRYLDPHGQPARIFTPVIRQVFDDRNRAVSTRYFYGFADIPGINAAGFARVDRRFDDRGNIVQEAYFGVEGEPIAPIRFGYHRIDRGYDARGTMVTEAYFGTAGQPILLRDTHHRVEHVADHRGLIVQTAYFDAQGAPTEYVDGYHQIRSAFDPVGRLVERRHFGVDGKPTTNRWDYHAERYTYSLRGAKTEERFVDVEGKPVLHRTKKYHRAVWGHNDRDALTYYAIFGVAGEPIVDARTGIHAQRFKRDALGRAIQARYFDADDQPMLNGLGIHRIDTAYDAHGNETSRALFGIDGEPLVGRPSYPFHRRSQRFDGPRLVEQAFFGPDGQPMPDPSGYVRRRLEYDAGQLARTIGIAPDGRETVIE